jgi:alkylation response protein AidB-like acyl-CoA dehydrogenase
VYFDLTDDQRALRATAAELCARRFPMESLREVLAVGSLDRAAWTDLADSGLFGVHLSEEAGGIDMGRAGLAIVFRELGRALVPGPLVSTAVCAGVLADAKPDDVVAVVELRSGAPYAIEALARPDWVVLLGDDVRVVRGDVLGATRNEGEPLDPLTPMTLVRDLPAGDPVGGPDLAIRLRRDGALLTAALASGVAATCTDIAAAYAQQREQFGRPIGSFQAVKHLLADMRVRADLAEVAVDAAAVGIDQGDAKAAVSAAKVVAGEAAVENGRSCVQIHGGMGFAWEVDAHLYQKRAWVLQHQFGSVSDHARMLADSPRTG